MINLTDDTIRFPSSNTNERILELARQVWPDPNISHVNHKKFAELIIRECLEQVRDEVQYEYDWKLADAVSKRVLEHFGVKD